MQKEQHLTCWDIRDSTSHGDFGNTGEAVEIAGIRASNKFWLDASCLSTSRAMRCHWDQQGSGGTTDNIGLVLQPLRVPCSALLCSAGFACACFWHKSCGFCTDPKAGLCRSRGTGLALRDDEHPYGHNGFSRQQLPQ